MSVRSEVEMTIAGLLTDANSNSPVLILRDETGKVGLPIWIGIAEATAIASAIKKVSFPRPMTHDLLRNSIEKLGGKISRIVINSLREHTFFATIEVQSGENVLLIDSRPSDALAIAVRTDARIFVDAEVLRDAKIELVEEGSPEDGGVDELEAAGRTHDFSSIEKDRWADLLAGMDPDDFKYKM